MILLPLPLEGCNYRHISLAWDWFLYVLVLSVISTFLVIHYWYILLNHSLQWISSATNSVFITVCRRHLSRKSYLALLLLGHGGHRLSPGRFKSFISFQNIPSLLLWDRSWAVSQKPLCSGTGDKSALPPVHTFRSLSPDTVSTYSSWIMKAARLAV